MPKSAYAGCAAAIANVRVPIWIAAGLVGALVLFLRSPDVFINPQFWAEDGPVFWQDQAELGWRALFKPYAGYFNVAPRLVAALASWLNPAHAPRVFGLAAIALTLWSACTASTCVDDPRLGVLLAIGLLLPPIYGGEVFGNVTNTQWLMAPTLALLLASKPAPNRVAFAAIAGLSGPFSVFLLPLAAARAIARKDIVAATIGAAGLIQLAALSMAAATPLGQSEPDLAHLAGVVVFRCFVSSPVCLVLGAAVLLYALLWRGHRWLRLCGLFLAAAVALGVVLKFMHAPDVLDAEVNGARYFYIPRVALLLCAVTLLFKDFVAALLGALFVAAMLFADPTALQKPAPPDARWRDHFRAGAQLIETNPPGFAVRVPERARD
ncbi:hypothetical protein HNR60_001767 [Rhodopseudomonas rhenobacensis]|uniref:Uncharacterized protein n=1 Tax=Rhodopseudomonas rhenobacensis TaxID=87461 RepID=A0A7W8DYN2_9BRAD|nr:hypothetical protein [Rhodopseudomonas rhenobacensis]MBB5047015.1 hypothetical protein [Rhodopseudomonas rhenobacensis]